MTKNDDKRVPALRFKGFNDDWAQRMLGKIAVIIMGQSPDGSTYSKVPSTYILVQGNADIKNGWVKPRLWSSQSTKEAQKGDIILTVRAPVGEVAKTNYDVVLGRGVAGIRGNDFIFHLLTLMNINNYWNKFSTGSTFESINSNDIKKAIVNIPPQLEQGKIGKLLNTLNNLIALQQRKEKLLKQIQQAIYYNIYPEYGTKIPIIRHREFNKEWSIVSFNKLYKKSKEKNVFTYGEDKIISDAKMYFKHESQNSSKDYLKTYNVFKKGDIAFEGNRSEGFSHGRFVQNNIGDGIVSHVFDVFTPLNKENLNYWKYAIHNEHIMKYVLVKSTTKATMMNNLSTKDFLKQKIAVPNSCEMKKISHLLKGLDDQLEFSKRKIKILTKVKQFLLQNMFI